MNLKILENTNQRIKSIASDRSASGELIKR